MSKISNAVHFIGEVRQEIGKVTWASRRETLMTTGFVFVFAVIAAMYFAFVDNIIVRILRPLIGG